MARTMKWPPVPESGRIPMVEGGKATRIAIMLTLRDLNANPFNERDLSLGDLTFKIANVARAAIERTLRRLRTMIRVENIAEEGTPEDKTFTINYVDLETHEQGSLNING